MNNIAFETERLSLRKMTEHDAPFLFDLLNSEGWKKYIGDRNIQTFEDAEHYITKKLNPNFDTFGYGYMVAVRKSDQVPIGICGILKRDGLDLSDVGFALLPNFEGQGYAYEMTISMIEYCKSNFDVHHLCGITLPENVKSIQLLEKIGLTFKKNINIPQDNETLMYFDNQ